MLKKPINLFLMICFSLPAATAGETDIFARFKLQVFEDGKPTEFYVVGHVIVSLNAGTYMASWDDIWISPIHPQKQMLMKPGHNSTSNGTIKNLIVVDNKIFLDLVLEQGRVMKITGTKPAGSTEYRIEGSGVWWIELVQKSVKTEWKPVSKPIVLPYAEIF